MVNEVIQMYKNNRGNKEMSKIKMTVLGLIAAIGLGLPQTAQAVPVETVLWLSIDESGSIGSSNYDIQKEGYRDALQALIPIDGSIAIGAATFNSNNFEISALAVIDSQQALDDLTDAIFNDAYNDGNTAIGNAIDFGVAAIDAFVTQHLLDCAIINCVIDVSTDGQNNTGGSPDTAANTALASDIIVNCLGIGNNADCDFATGFTETADSFDDIEDSLSRKLARETGQDLPEPSALMLIGVGLLSAGVFARRRKAA